MRCPEFDTDAENGGITFDHPASSREWQQLPPIPARPAVVVSSSVGRWLRVANPERYLPRTPAELDALWQTYQRDYANQLGAVHVIARDAGHCVHIDEPALVALAVDAVVSAARSGQPVQLTPDIVDSATGRLVS
jgi:hypothetical protein